MGVEDRLGYGDKVTRFKQTVSYLTKLNNSHPP